MTPLLWLSIYCGLVLVASLAGGWIPLVIRLTHRRMQIALSFVAGVMLGVGLLHLLPHGYHKLGSIDDIVLCVMIGFLLMFFLERLFHFHHHDVSEEADDVEMHGHSHVLGIDSHGHEHGHNHAHEPTALSPNFSWQGAAVGLTLHGLIDGMVLGAGVAAETNVTGNVPMWAGLGAFLAIFLHKPFDSLTIGTLMATGRWSNAQRHLVNTLYALVTPCGVLLFYFGDSRWGSPNLVGWALGFAAGAFVCIATSDLLPELQFHSHDRGKLSCALIAGVTLAWSIMYLESSGHDHHHGGPGHRKHIHADDEDHRSQNDPGA